jgi:hypothetical protein
MGTVARASPELSDDAASSRANEPIFSVVEIVMIFIPCSKYRL